MDNMKIYVNNQEIMVKNGTTLQELSVNYQDNFKYDIILAKVNGEHTELSHVIKPNEKIEFFDLYEREANRVYLNGLIFIIDYAFKKIFNGNIKVKHSLDKGLYIGTDIPIDNDKLLKLEMEINRLVESNVKIEKLTVPRSNAFNYYKKVNKTEKFENLKYNTNSYLTMYKLDTHYDYLYSHMPTSTGVLKYFKFNLINENGFVLTFPTIYMTDGVKAYEHREHVFNMFKESYEWSKRLGIDYVNDLNKIISSGKINDIILTEEMEKNSKILNAASKIIEKGNVKIVLIAGPSSSGKTTTTNKLCLALRSRGRNPKMISMDDFFKNREETPLDEFGNKDYESIDALDLDLFNEKMSDLLSLKETIMPEYNFITGEKEFKKTMQLEENDILLIEGIHAMNPRLLTNIPDEFKIKIYLSALNDLNIDRSVRISTTDNRLLRRIVRDNRTRGHTVNHTLEAWAKVRNGEEKYIFPYQDMADITINTALTYEIGVLKVYVEPLLYSVDITSPYYDEAKRLLNFLRLFLPIPSEEIPNDSILREFVGGGCFKI